MWVRTLWSTARIQSAARSLAERGGFEPPVPLRVHVISNHAHSTTLSPLRRPARKFFQRPAVGEGARKVAAMERVNRKSGKPRGKRLWAQRKGPPRLFPTAALAELALAGYFATKSRRSPAPSPPRCPNLSQNPPPPRVAVAAFGSRRITFRSGSSWSRSLPCSPVSRLRDPVRTPRPRSARRAPARSTS